MDLTFEITGYRPDAMFDDFADGTSGQYDAATIRILSGNLVDQTFQVYVAAGSADAALWSRIGDTLSAEIAPGDLQNLDILFSGAFALKEVQE